MARLSLSSLRIRLLLLVLLGVLPALGLTLYVSWEHERQARAAVQHDALRLAELAAADHQRLIEGARQLLAALARLPDVRQASPACPRLFADLLTQYRSYANLGVADPTGHVVCSGVPLAGPASAADRAYFQRALTTRAFAVGEYQVGRITGRAAVNFGQPILDPAGHVTGVVFAALDLGWLNEFARRAAAPPGSTFTVVDWTVPGSSWRATRTGTDGSGSSPPTPLSSRWSSSGGKG
jgi:C4-dicarboxylate-specific signal transduction histidine kinase